MAEVDGNRTRRAGIACTTRFEGGGCHQASRHLHRRRYRCPLALCRGASYAHDMKKLLVVLVVLALAAFAVKKLQDA